MSDKVNKNKEDDKYFIWFVNPFGGQLQAQICDESFLPKAKMVRKEKLVAEMKDHSLVALMSMFPVATMDDGAIMILHPIVSHEPINTASLTEGFQ